MMEWILKAVKRVRADRAENVEKKETVSADVDAAVKNCPTMFDRLRWRLDQDVNDYNHAMREEGPTAWLKIEASKDAVVIIGYRLIALVSKIPSPTPVAIYVRWTEGSGGGNKSMVIKCRPGFYMMGKRLVPVDKVAAIAQEIIEPLLER